MHCEICGKTTAFGKKVAHDRMYVNGRSPRKVKPNLQHMRVPTASGSKRVCVCTRCMRTMKNKGTLQTGNIA